MFGNFLDDVNRNDGRITMASQTRPSGTLCGLAQVSPVKGKRWKALLALPTLADRVAALQDPATRAELVAEGVDKGLYYDPNHIYPLGTGPSPDYSETDGRSVAQLAEEAGVHPVELDHRPPDRERRARAVQHLVLQPQRRGPRRRC